VTAFLNRARRFDSCRGYLPGEQLLVLFAHEAQKVVPVVAVSLLRRSRDALALLAAFLIFAVG